MKKSNKNYFIVYLICFVTAWLSAIFYFDKNDFDIEFREKETTNATIFNFDSYEVLEELYDGRKASKYDIEYVEYFYVINGIKYKYGSEDYDKGYSINDEIEIEYVKSNSFSSRIKVSNPDNYNFFKKNFIMVSIFSFLGMLGVFYAIDCLKKQDTGWR